MISAEEPAHVALLYNSGGIRKTGPTRTVKSFSKLEMVREYGSSLAETARRLGVSTSGIAELLLRNDRQVHLVNNALQYTGRNSCVNSVV